MNQHSELRCPDCRYLIGRYAHPLYSTVGGDGRLTTVLAETLLWCRICGNDKMVPQTLCDGPMTETTTEPRVTFSAWLNDRANDFESYDAATARELAWLVSEAESLGVAPPESPGRTRRAWRLIAGLAAGFAAPPAVSQARTRAEG